MIYALDTNIVIRYLRNTPSVQQHFDEAIIKGDGLVIPKVADYEIRRGFRHKHTPNKEAAYNVLVSSNDWCDIAEMDDESWERAEKVYTDLCRKGLSIGELDILIAAFCLVNGYTIVTNNTRHFRYVDGLDVTDWTESDR